MSEVAADRDEPTQKCDEPTTETMDTTEDNNPLTFANVCQDAWNEAAERVENGRLLLDSVRTVIRDLEQLEKQHSVNLRKLANKLEIPESEKGTTEAAVSAFRSDLVNRAHHSMQFAMSIRSDVLDATLEPAIANHASVFNQIKLDAINSSRTLADLKANHAKALQSVSTAKKIALRATLRAQQPDLTLTQQKVRAHISALEAAQEAVSANAAYHESVTLLNDAQHKFQKQLDAMLTALEDMDKKRVDCLRDSLMKTYIYRTAQSRNTEYDTNSAIGTTKSVDANKDIQEFLKDMMQCTAGKLEPLFKEETILSWPEIETCCVQRRRSADLASETAASRGSMRSANADLNPAAAVRQFFKQTNLDQVVQQAQAGLRELGTTLTGKDDSGSTSNSKRDRMRHGLKEFGTSETLEQLLQDVARYDSELSEAIPKPELEFDYEGLLNLIWTSSFEKIYEQWGDKGLASIVEGLAIPVNRLQFCNAFLHVASARNFRMTNMDSFHALCHVCQGLLNHCEAHNDFWCGRIMMLSCHQIYVEGPLSVDPQKSVTSWRFPSTIDEAKELELKYNTEANGSSETPGDDAGGVLPEGSTFKKSENPSEQSTVRVIWRLTRGLYEHPLWNRVAFWEEAFILTLSEDQQRRVLMEAWKTQNLVLGRDLSNELDARERQFKLKNPCSQSLCLFAFHMTSFGIKHTQIRTMVEKLCVKYGFGVELAQQLVECLGQKGTAEKVDSKSVLRKTTTVITPRTSSVSSVTNV